MHNCMMYTIHIPLMTSPDVFLWASDSVVVKFRPVLGGVPGILFRLAIFYPQNTRIFSVIALSLALLAAAILHSEMM